MALWDVKDKLIVYFNILKLKKQLISPCPGVITNIFPISFDIPAYLLVVDDSGPSISLYIIDSNFNVLYSKIDYLKGLYVECYYIENLSELLIISIYYLFSK